MIRVYTSEGGKLTEVEMVDFGRFVAGQTEVKKTLVLMAKEGVSDLTIELTQADPGITVVMNGKPLEKGEKRGIPTARKDNTLLKGERSQDVIMVIRSEKQIAGGVQPVKFNLSWLWPA